MLLLQELCAAQGVADSSLARLDLQFYSEGRTGWQGN